MFSPGLGRAGCLDWALHRADDYRLGTSDRMAPETTFCASARTIPSGGLIRAKMLAARAPRAYHATS